VFDGVEQTQAPPKLSLLYRVQHFRTTNLTTPGRPAIVVRRSAGTDP
jgi:hypothetical protein